jgi:hypothetical protein
MHDDDGTRPVARWLRVFCAGLVVNAISIGIKCAKAPMRKPTTDHRWPESPESHGGNAQLSNRNTRTYAVTDLKWGTTDQQAGSALRFWSFSSYKPPDPGNRIEAKVPTALPRRLIQKNPAPPVRR